MEPPPPIVRNSPPLLTSQRAPINNVGGHKKPLCPSRRYTHSFSSSYHIPHHILDDEAPASAPATKQEPAPTPAPAARGTGAQKSRGGPAARGGKYYARGGKPQSKDAAPVTETPEGNKPGAYLPSFFFLANLSVYFSLAGDSRGDRGDFRGERRGRGRGGRGDSTRRGRPFDRHSQTGLTSVSLPFFHLPSLIPFLATLTRRSNNPGAVQTATLNSKPRLPQK